MAKEHIVKILKGDTVESHTLIPSFFDKMVESNLNMINFLYQIYIHFQIDGDRQISQSILDRQRCYHCLSIFFCWC